MQDSNTFKIKVLMSILQMMNEKKEKFAFSVTSKNLDTKSI